MKMLIAIRSKILNDDSAPSRPRDADSLQTGDSQELFFRRGLTPQPKRPLFDSIHSPMSGDFASHSRAHKARDKHKTHSSLG
jgi:hypothetical protein